MFTGFFVVLKVRRGQSEVKITITGPNDAGRVVWAIGKLFYFFIRVFLILTNLYSLYLCLEEWEWVVEGADDNNGPRRRILRRLGH